MFGLRQRLALGLGGMLLLLIVTGAISLLLLTNYSGTVNRIFRENYNSVVFGQAMKDAVDQALDDLNADLPGATHPLADQAQASFEVNFAKEAGNITVAGEREAVADLQAHWQSFLVAYRAARRQDLSVAERQDRYRAVVLPAGQAVKTAAQRIIDLNLQNIVSTDGTIRHDAEQARRLMVVLVGAGMILAVVCIALFTRSLLGPLRTLTRSAREIEQGNLDLVVAVPTRDELGQLAEAFNAMAVRLRRDQRSDRQRLVRAERTTLLALDSLPDAVATITTDGTVDLANQTAQRLFRLRPGVRLDAVDHPGLLACWRHVVASGQPVHPQGYETAIHIEDGDERFFLPHALPIKESDGQSIGVTLVLADITSLRHLDEMKSNLLAVVSHELKTPLTGLRMATHLLLDEKIGSLSTKQLDLALSARDDANRLHTIIEGLLDIGRLESGRALLDLQALDPRTLVDEAIAEVATAFRDQGIGLAAELPATLPRVLADRVRIAHVFSNLLGNALKYTPRGGHVRVAAQIHGETVEFQVLDIGCGIPLEHRVRIFERFYRLPGQTIVGAGLGLAIAKEVVQAHGGRIWLADQTGPGSTFVFSLTVAPDPAGA